MKMVTVNLPLAARLAPATITARRNWNDPVTQILGPERGQPGAFGYKYSQARERCWRNLMPWIICPAQVRTTYTCSLPGGTPSAPLHTPFPFQGTSVGKRGKTPLGYTR